MTTRFVNKGIAQKRLKRRRGTTDSMAGHTTIKVDWDGVIARDSVRKAVEEHIPAPLKAIALEPATNLLYTSCDLLGLKEQYVVDKLASGCAVEINGPVVDWMYRCKEKGMAVGVFTRNRKDLVENVLWENDIREFQVVHVDDKLSYMLQWRAGNPAENLLWLDDSIRFGLLSKAKRLGGYVIYVNGHNAMPAKFLKGLGFRTANDASLMSLVRDSAAWSAGQPNAKSIVATA